MALKPLLSALGVALLLAGSAAAVSLGRQWLAVERYNAALAAGDLAAAGRHDLPEALLARGLAGARAGDIPGALRAYQALARTSGPGAADARFNAANLYLRQALALDSQRERDLLLPLAELAKQGYRDLLRRHPEHWDAKYNLERTLLLAPDPGPEEISDFAAPERGPQALVPVPTDPRPLP